MNILDLVNKSKVRNSKKKTELFGEFMIFKELSWVRLLKQCRLLSENLPLNIFCPERRIDIV